MPTITERSVDAMVRRARFIEDDRATRIGVHVHPAGKKVWLRKHWRMAIP